MDISKTPFPNEPKVVSFRFHSYSTMDSSRIAITVFLLIHIITGYTSKCIFMYFNCIYFPLVLNLRIVFFVVLKEFQNYFHEITNPFSSFHFHFYPFLFPTLFPPSNGFCHIFYASHFSTYFLFCTFRS